MNLTQAEAIASLYSELLESIDLKRIDPPEYTNGHRFTHEQAFGVSIEDGQVKVHWSRYAGCGDYDTDDTYHRLDAFFD